MRLKELKVTDLQNLPIIQLYNILFGPLVDTFKFSKYDSGKAVGTVYGATILPIKRRNNALENLANEIKLDSVIYSGGVSWTGASDETSFRRTRDLIDQLPAIEKSVIEKIGEDYFYQEYFAHREIIYTQMQEDMEFFNYIIDEFDNRKDLEESFEHWMIKYIFNSTLSYFVHYSVTETEIFDADWKSNHQNKSFDRILYDDESLNTAENAINSLKKFVSRKQENPNVDTMIIISDWPYLLRAILTTKKFAEKYNVPVKVVGYPANYSKDVEWKYNSFSDFYNHPSLGVIPNILKMIKYDDVGDMDITKYLEMDHLIDGGPKVLIGDEPLSTYIEDFSHIL